VDTEQAASPGNTCPDVESLDKENQHLTFDTKEEAKGMIIVSPEFSGEDSADNNWPDGCSENDPENEHLSQYGRGRQRRPTVIKLTRTENAGLGLRNGKVRKLKKSSHKDVAGEKMEPSDCKMEPADERKENSAPSTSPSPCANIEVCKNTGRCFHK
jgi:hypothetical protein